MNEKQAMASTVGQALARHGDDGRQDGADAASADITAVQTQDAPDDMQDSVEQTQDDIVKTIGRTTYNVYVHFDENAKETMGDKIKRLVLADIAAGRV